MSFYYRRQAITVLRTLQYSSDPLSVSRQEGIDGCDVSIAFLTFDDSWLKHLSEASQGLAGFGIRRGS